MSMSAAEADLARRDRHVPGLTTVLDPDAFATAVRHAVPQADVGEGRIAYLRYKPRTMCRLSYQLDVGGAPVELDVRACRPEDFDTLVTGHDTQSLVPGPLGAGRILLEDLAVIITVFPNDLRLLTLPDLWRPDARQRLLRESLPDNPDLWQGELRRLGYRPERRFVAELSADGDGGRVVLKAYTRKGYERGKHNGGAFVSRGPLRLARLLGSSDERRLLAFEWLPGAMLQEYLAAPELDRTVVAEAGAALATLHEQQPDGLPFWTREDEVAAVTAVAAEIGYVWPPLAVRAERLAQRIATALTAAPPLATPLHGDFSAAQLLVAPPAPPAGQPRVAVIDLDWSCRGDPADDLGNLIAQAERHVLDGVHSARWEESFIAALLDGYRRATTRPTPERVELYTALNLLRRARHPFRTREPDWPQRTELLVDRAEAITR